MLLIGIVLIFVCIMFFFLRWVWRYEVDDRNFWEARQPGWNKLPPLSRRMPPFLIYLVLSMGVIMYFTVNFWATILGGIAVAFLLTVITFVITGR